MNKFIKGLIVLGIASLFTSCGLKNITDKFNSAVGNYNSSENLSSISSISSSLNESSSENSSSNSSSSDVSQDLIVENTVFDDFKVSFLELGMEYAGDSVYIKCGDLDIIIDAGSRPSSAPVIEEYVNKYCTDGKIEYVIATHAHQDHIAGMFGNVSTSGKYKNYKNETVYGNGILYYYDVDTLIDFAITDATSETVNKYNAAVEYAVSKGTKHYTAADCWTESNGASRTYYLGENASMSILYNYYYANSAAKTTGEENNYSVVTLFNYGDHNFLFTGDLELEGETKLVEYYDGSTDEKTLPHCDVFKGGHHGSATSSNEGLLSKITPDICCVCCCAGNSEYTNNYNNIFPTQSFISRIAKYTDRVYVTSVFNETTKDFGSMNGDICVSSNGTQIGLYASNNLTKLKDTVWFNETVYVIDEKICPKKGSKDFYTQDTEGVQAVARRIWPSD